MLVGSLLCVRHCRGDSEVSGTLLVSSRSSYSNLKRHLNKAVFCDSQCSYYYGEQGMVLIWEDFLEGEAL